MPSPKRILFVDDEPFVLDGLRRMFRGMRAEWEMRFASSGAEALELLAQTPADVVVSDMRMPQMNGAELLERVMQKHPGTVRLILTGQADQQLILRAVNCAHQILAKPCSPEVLKATIERACTIERRGQDPRAVLISSRLTRLPTVPRIYDELVAKMRDPEAAIEDVAAIVSRDPAIGAKILQIVNSAYFGLRRRIVDLVEAVNFLGLDTLRALVLSVQAFGHFEKDDLRPLSIEGLWQESLAAAAAARAIADAHGADESMIGDAFVAGLLHDVGRLVLAANLGRDYARAVERAAREHLPLYVAEQCELSMDHAEVGGVLFGLWGLPDVLVEAAEWHHRPSSSGIKGFRPLTCVHLAACWAEQSADLHLPAQEPDAAYLAQNGFSERLADWRAACEGVRRTVAKS